MRAIVDPSEEVPHPAHAAHLCRVQVAALERVFFLAVPVHFFGRNALVSHAVVQVSDVPRRSRAVHRVEEIPSVSDLFELRALGISPARQIDEPHRLGGELPVLPRPIERQPLFAVRFGRGVVIHDHAVVGAALRIVGDVGIAPRPDALVKVRPPGIFEQAVRFVDVGLGGVLPDEQIVAHRTARIAALSVAAAVAALRIDIHAERIIELLLGRVLFIHLQRHIVILHEVVADGEERGKLFLLLPLLHPRREIVHIQLAARFIIEGMHIAVIAVHGVMEQLLCGKRIVDRRVPIHLGISRDDKPYFIPLFEGHGLLVPDPLPVRHLILCKDVSALHQRDVRLRARDQPWIAEDARGARFWCDKGTHRICVPCLHPRTRQRGASALPALTLCRHIGKGAVLGAVLIEEVVIPLLLHERIAVRCLVDRLPLDGCGAHGLRLVQIGIGQFLCHHRRFLLILTGGKQAASRKTGRHEDGRRGAPLHFRFLRSRTA